MAARKEVWFAMAVTTVEPATIALFTGPPTRVIDGDTIEATLTETLFCFIIGPNGGRVTFGSRDDDCRFLATWCPEMNEKGGVEARMFTYEWLFKHDHPKQHQYATQLEYICSGKTMRDSFKRALVYVRCTVCGAVLNNDLVSEGHATREKQVAAARSMYTEKAMDYARHLRALREINEQPKWARTLGSENRLRTLDGQQPLSLALDKQDAST